MNRPLRPRRRSLSPGLAAFLCAILPALAAADLRFEEGVARDPSDLRDLYREQHLVRREDGRIVERLVLYRCSDGTAFARKRIDYRRSATAPEFHFEDDRDGYREGLRRGDAATVFVQPSADAPERAAPVASPRLVADAGFDEFVRRNWPALVAGRPVPLEFAVPSRLESLGFTARRVGTASVAGESAWVFRLQLGGWVGWLAPAIDVYYGQDSRRLLRFEGLSNLRDDAGKAPLKARIDFERPPRAASEADWLAAARSPLSACRTGR